MSEPTEESALLSAERERKWLIERATLPRFLYAFIPAAVCWAILIWAIAKNLDGDELGLVVLVPLYLSILPGIWFTATFAYEWLAIATLKTPERYHAILHLSGALILASLVTFVQDNPFGAVQKFLLYFEHHGYFAMKLAVLTFLVGAQAYFHGKVKPLRDFPRYPLRWYASLLVFSLLVGLCLRPEDDVESMFHEYERTAYNCGTVIASYLGFFIGTFFAKESP